MLPHPEIKTWTQVSATNCAVRESHTVVIWKGHLIIFGGFNGEEILATPEVFYLLQQKWIPTFCSSTESKLKPRKGHTMCLDKNDNIILYGGITPFHEHVIIPQNVESLSLSKENDVINLNCTELLSPYMTDIMPQVALHTANIYQDKMYVFGGSTSDGKAVNDLWEFSFDTTTWVKRNTNGTIPEKRFSHNSALCNGKLYIFGGRTSGYGGRTEGPGGKVYNDIHMLDLEKMEWRLINATGDVPKLFGASMQEFKGKLYLFGGADDTSHVVPLNNTYVFCTETNTFCKPDTGNELPARRFRHASAVWENKLYTLGGDTQDTRSDRYRSDIWALTLEGSTVTSLTIKTPSFDLIRLFNEKTFADFVLEVEDKEFLVHKAIIASRCKFFANLFTSGMSDSNLTKLSITDANSASFEVLLRFIYCDPNLTVDEDIAFELLRLSDKYLLPDLKLECEKILSGLVNKENFLKIWKAAEAVESSVMNEAVISYVSKNTRLLKERGDLNNIPKLLLIQVYKLIASK